MAKEVNQPANTGFFVLALGLLIGFVIGFVMLLSRLPVDSDVREFRASQVEAPLDVAASFDFFDVLPGQRVARENVAPPIVAAIQQDAPVIVKPINQSALQSDVRLVATDAQQARVEATPVSTLGQESYYLQAGNFRAPDDAERARAAVLLLGLDAFIVTRQDNSGAIGHRVRVGPFFDASRLTDAKKRLRAGNVPYDIIKVTG